MAAEREGKCSISWHLIRLPTSVEVLMGVRPPSHARASRPDQRT